MVDFRIDTFEEFGQTPAASGGRREEVPEGWHGFKIARIVEDGERLELQLAHDDPGYWWVKLRITKANTPKWARKLVGELAGALAMSPAQWSSTPATDLTGSRVEAEIRHRQVDQKTFVNVWGFRPAAEAAEPEQTPAPKPAARTPHQKAKAAAADAGEGEDLIPF